ncbi:MAG: leucine-rich repeat domain-containing protein [Promethearchaeota archaeon]
MDQFVEVAGRKIPVRNHALVLDGLEIETLGEVSGLDSLRDLQYLIVRHTKLSRIGGIDHLGDLTNLVASDNEIGVISGLESLSKLEILNIANNQISEISGLDSLGKLKMLDLSHNRISEISGLGNLVNLQYLELHHNDIREISGLENLVNLEFLSLKNNKITEVKGIEYLVKLKTIELYPNPINKTPQLRFLDGMKAQDLVKYFQQQRGLITLEEMAADDSCSACTSSSCEVSSVRETTKGDVDVGGDLFGRWEERERERKAGFLNLTQNFPRLREWVASYLKARATALQSTLLLSSSSELDSVFNDFFTRDVPKFESYLQVVKPDVQLSAGEREALSDVLMEESSPLREAIRSAVRKLEERADAAGKGRELLEFRLVGVEPEPGSDLSRWIGGLSGEISRAFRGDGIK